jgi:hypothetical protein
MIEGYKMLESNLEEVDADIPVMFTLPGTDRIAMEPILELRNAIIIQATHDFLRSVPWSYEENSALNFFRSEWFATLLSMDEAVGSVDPERLIKLLKKRKEKRVKFVKYL